MNIRTRKFTAVLSLFATAGIVGTTNAQTSAPATEKVEKLEKFVVTGSLIPAAGGSTTVPLTVIGSAEIEKSGINTDVLDVLRSSLPSFYGGNNLGSDVANTNSGNTNGGSAISLRNRSTLVLINGRRAATSPVSATNGGNNFVDVSTIPMAAIDRIEVLTDGASATYGSDAVSGVVNIILKKNYTGAEAGGSYNFSTNKGNWESRSYYAVAGATTDKTSVLFTTEWKNSDPLIQSERAYSAGLFRSPTYAGIVSSGNDFYYLNPSLNAPPRNLDQTGAQLNTAGIYKGPLDQTAASQFFDLSSKPTLLAQAQRRSFTASIEHRLTDSTTLFGDFIYSLNETETVLNAQPVSGSVAANNPNNPFDITVTARNRFINFPRIYQNESANFHGVLGIKGSFGEGWTYEAGANFNRTNHHFRNLNLIDAAAYTAAVANGTFNPFARNQAPGVIEAMLGTQVRDFYSTLRQLDAQISGPVFRLPAGDVKVGVGASYIWEVLDFTNDRNDQTGGWLQATPRGPFHAQYNLDSYYAEVLVPIVSEKNALPGIRTLDLSIAGRHDIYSNTSDPTVPKYSLRYQPFNDELLFRGTYSESFTAPSLYQLKGPTSSGFTSSISVARFGANGQALGTQSGSRQYRSQTGSNAKLNPSQSRNWTAGVVWSPKAIKGLSLSVDYFNIDERDLITTVPTNTIIADVERLGPKSPYASVVRQAISVAGESHFTDGAPITAPGQVTARPSDEIWVTNALVNVAGYWQDGFDVKASYTFKTQGAGKFVATSAATLLRNYYVQVLPSDPAVGYQGGYFNSGTESTGVFARYRLNNRLDWSLGNWTAGLGHTYVPEISDLTNGTPFTVSSYHKIDLQVSHSFMGYSNRWLKGLTATVGMNNVFNRMPPLIPSEGNQSHDINAYDPIGRLVYIQAKYKF
jgi:iron complex outermembrane receptor protein